ncbi:MAG: hypothetical protein NTV21_04620 [Planctomycetota bacterium]|nr:hypothetical protein [Planctomycetota bacterium]
MQNPTRILALTAAGLVAILGTVFFLYLRPSGEGDSSQPGDPAAAPEVAAPDAPRAPRDLDTRENADDREQDAEAPDRPPPTGSRTFTGTFVVERANGAIDTHASGEFTLVLMRERGISARVLVAASEGRWSAAPKDEALASLKGITIRSAKADGRAVSVLAPRDLVGLRDGLEVRVRESLSTLLRVVDERAGIDLAPVALVRSASADLHPGFVEERQKRQLSGPAGELRSPLDLIELKDVAQGAQRLFVGAPGYAWQAVTLDVGSGTERKVVLAGGGSLRLRLSMVPDPGTRLRVRGEKLGPVLDAELPALDALELDGLAPDTYTVEVDASPEQGGGRLAEGQAAVVPGAAASLTLFLGSARGAERVDLELVVRVPEAWELGRLAGDLLADGLLPAPLALRFERAEDQSGFRVFVAKAKALAVGSYVLQLGAVSQREPVELSTRLAGPGGTVVQQIDVGPPAEVVLQLFDERGGDAVRPEWVGFARSNAAGEVRNAVSSAYFVAELDGYRLLAPAGDYAVSLPADCGWGLVERTLRLTPGTRTERRAVQRFTELQIVLLDQGVAQPFPPGWSVYFSDGRDMVHEPLPRLQDARQYIARLPSGGSYTLEFDPLPGYEPLQPLDCLVPDRTRGKAEIPLLRQR